MHPCPILIAVNDAPVDVPDNATTPEDTPIIIPVLSNDYDVDNNSTLLRVYICNSPANGTAVVNTTAFPNTITYTPSPNFFGPDSFTYFISDGALNSSCVAVNVTVISGVYVFRMCASVETRCWWQACYVVMFTDALGLVCMCVFVVVCVC
jgi:hypothetical protein